MTNTKSTTEKYAANALVAVEVINEALAVFEDQAWSASVQLALFTLKLMILMYLKSAAEHEPEPAASTTDASPSNRTDAMAATEDALDQTPDMQDPSADEQSDPQK